MKYIYSLTITLLLLPAKNLSAQKLNYSDAKAFWYGMEVKRINNDATKASSYQLMKWTLFDLNKSEPKMSEVLAGFETFLSDYDLCEKFFFEAVKIENGQDEDSRMLLYSLCGDMQASIHIVDFIRLKYKAFFRSFERQEKTADNQESQVKTESANENEILSVQGKEKHFENNGLKYHTVISIKLLSKSQISGTVTSDEYTDENINTANFVGTIENNQLKIRFVGNSPKIGDGWPDAPWQFKKVDGKEVLTVVLEERDYETNQWKKENVEFHEAIKSEKTSKSIRYQVITNKSYFYSHPTIDSKHSSFVIKGDQVEAIFENESQIDWIYAKFENDNGKITTGFLKASTLKRK